MARSSQYDSGILSVGDSVQKDEEPARRLGNAPVAQSTQFWQHALRPTAPRFCDLFLEIGIKERAIGVA